jgi:hypothetical protein
VNLAACAFGDDRRRPAQACRVRVTREQPERATKERQPGPTGLLPATSDRRRDANAMPMSPKARSSVQGAPQPAAPEEAEHPRVASAGCRAALAGLVASEVLPTEDGETRGAGAVAVGAADVAALRGFTLHRSVVPPPGAVKSTSQVPGAFVRVQAPPPKGIAPPSLGGDMYS